MTPLVSIAASLHKLQVLDLSHNRIGACGLEVSEVPPAYRLNPSSRSSPIPFAFFLRRSISVTTSKIVLPSSFPSPLPVRSSLSHVLSSSSSPTLLLSFSSLLDRILHSSSSSLGDKGAMSLARYLRHLPFLSSLSLSACQVDKLPSLVSHLLFYLVLHSSSSFSCLSSLSSSSSILTPQQIHDAGAGLVGSVLYTNSRIFELRLSHNQIADEGLELFASWILVRGLRSNIGRINLDANLLGPAAPLVFFVLLFSLTDEGQVTVAPTG